MAFPGNLAVFSAGGSGFSVFVSSNESLFEGSAILLVLSLRLFVTELSGRSLGVVVPAGFLGPVSSVLRVLMFHELNKNVM